MPLVLSMHGLSLNSAQQERLSGMSTAAERAGYIVAYPDGTGFIPRWDTAGDTDVQFLRDLIAQLEGRLSIDPARVYATGISNGAQMAYRLGCTNADQIAGLGLVAGGYPDACQPSRPIPIVAFHGTADTILPYNGKSGRLAIPAWAAGAAAQNGCTSGPATSLQQGSVTGQTWDGCRDNAAVTLYTIAGGGHSWPGTHESFWSMMTTHDIDASPTMLAFFADHPRP
jgi:polyhydroxybutyrate depolymerase